MTKEEYITEIMKRVDEMTPEQKKQFLAYLKTISTERDLFRDKQENAQ